MDVPDAKVPQQAARRAAASQENLMSLPVWRYAPERAELPAHPQAPRGENDETLRTTHDPSGLPKRPRFRGKSSVGADVIHQPEVHFPRAVILHLVRLVSQPYVADFKINKHSL